MFKRRVIFMISAALLGLVPACGNKVSNSAPPTQVAKTQQPPKEPSALPNNAFKAAISLIDPPAKLRTGEKETIRVNIRNNSDAMWWARGAPVNTRSDNKFYIAAGNRWLKADGSLVTNMDGRYGIPKDLAPGEATEVPLTITAPKDPGDYTLEVDVIQEQVAWFSDKGSPTAKTKITVVK
ncbi:MAG TPA: hypothetical protein VE863_11170 [Pyrinomonadaceae bacterium]|jgi:hypothetical protein|nr:hypothetical protein [Pyrinomonadaceae bacterium]